MTPHLKESETHKPLMQTATTANRVERRKFRGVVARPFTLYKQNDTTSQGFSDSPSTDTDSYNSKSYGADVSGCCRTAVYIVITE